MDRVILHCDCNSFFASVETVLNPAYRSVPMAVCGSEEDRHGIVLAKNEMAKRFGIETAETVHSAKRKCPGLVIAKPHHTEYVTFSKRVNEIYADYTDMIEPFGIDESWLDVTASQKLFGSGEKIANEIRERIKRETGLTVSVGVSFNKVFAKLGSDYKKPDATTVISRDNYKQIVYPLPVGSLLFVGKKTCEQLRLIGVRTVGELSELSREMLVSRFGKAGNMLYEYSHGLDESPVAQRDMREDRKSVGSGFTFRHDLVTSDEYRIGIEYLADDIGRRLRRLGMLCTTVQLTVKDEYLRTIQRQRPQSPPTDISREIAKTAYAILSDEWSFGRPVRMLTVTATGLVPRGNSAEQISLFDDGEDERRSRAEKREKTVDEILLRYGSGAITSGAVLSTDIGIEKSKDR
jgi:DNA polymerase-4